MARTFRIEKISAVALIIMALWLLVLPLRWILAVMLAGLFHELCHYSAVKVLGGRIIDFSIYGGGMKMDANGLSAGKQLFCTLAGPIGGLVILLAARRFPELAICVVVQSVYNLLPIWPLDGGRALRLILRMLFLPAAAEKIAGITEKLTLTVITGAALYAGIVLKMGLLPVILPLSVIVRKNSLQTGSETSTIDGTIQ